MQLQREPRPDGLLNILFSPVDPPPAPTPDTLQPFVVSPVPFGGWVDRDLRKARTPIETDDALRRRAFIEQMERRRARLFKLLRRDGVAADPGASASATGDPAAAEAAGQERGARSSEGAEDSQGCSGDVAGGRAGDADGAGPSSSGVGGQSSAPSPAQREQDVDKLRSDLQNRGSVWNATDFFLVGQCNLFGWQSTDLGLSEKLAALSAVAGKVRGPSQLQ